MARWGYSVNIASLEPFNVTDQLLSYRTVSLANPYSEYTTICPENRVTWHADTLLPVVIDQWVTDIADFVRGPVDTTSLSTSPLGEDGKLFIMSYTDAESPNTTVSNYFLPFHNPAVDILDVHRYLYAGGADTRYTFDMDTAFRSTFLNNGVQKPMQNGEIGTFGRVEGYDSYKYFSNYDLSFHNELWTSAFFGNMGVASSWLWGRVFWWEQTLPPPPYESPQQNPYWPMNSNLLNAPNYIYPSGNLISIENKKLYHNIKPINDLYNNSDVISYGLFNGVYNVNKSYDPVGEVEVYYLSSPEEPIAIGWVHNTNAYWENNYYVINTDSTQNFFGCTAPPTDHFTLTGLQPGFDYYITWFPTRMGEVPLPDNAIDTSRTGVVVLDMTTLPLGDTANNYLDTLRMDYAFVIAPQPIQRSMEQFGLDEREVDSIDWDFRFYPNPARDIINVEFPNDAPVTLCLNDLTGRRINMWTLLSASKRAIQLGSLAPGAYHLKAFSGGQCKAKTLLIR